MALSTGGQDDPSIDVRFDVMGWNAEQSDANTAECEKIRLFAHNAVLAGFDALELAEAINDYQEGRLFEKVTISINDLTAATIVTIFAVAAGYTNSLSEETLLDQFLARHSA